MAAKHPGQLQELLSWRLGSKKGETRHFRTVVVTKRNMETPLAIVLGRTGTQRKRGEEMLVSEPSWFAAQLDARSRSTPQSYLVTDCKL